MDRGDDPRSRIRDAALRQFAAHGFKGATVRGIAQEAGVSPGLVQHHFPSKQALRDACDQQVVTFLRDFQLRGVIGGGLAGAGFMTDTPETVALLGPYVAMGLISDAPTAARWFDELADLYDEILTSGQMGPPLPEGEDTPAIAAVYTAMVLGLAVLAKPLYRRLGMDEKDPTAVARLGRARLFLAAQRLVHEDLEARMHAGFDRYEREHAKGEDQ